MCLEIYKIASPDLFPLVIIIHNNCQIIMNSIIFQIACTHLRNLLHGLLQRVVMGIYYSTILITNSMSKKVHPDAIQHKKQHISQITLYPLEGDFFVKECRICLVSEESDCASYISPCECNGSLKYVHKHCLRQWLQAKIKKEPIETQETMERVACQLCKYQIPVSMKTNKSCYSRDKVCQNIDERLFLFVICVIGVVFSLAMLAYSSAMMWINLKAGEKPINAVDNSVYVVSIIINFLLFVFFCFHIAPYLIEKRVEVSLSQD